MIAIVVRPLLTSEDLVRIGTMEAGDDIEFSAETAAQIADVDAHVRKILECKETYPLVYAYNREDDELRRADDREKEEDEADEIGAIGNEMENFQNWKAVREKQRAIARELANLVSPPFLSRSDAATQPDQRKLNIVARYLSALLADERGKKR